MRVRCQEVNGLSGKGPFLVTCFLTSLTEYFDEELQHKHERVLNLEIMQANVRQCFLSASSIGAPSYS